MHEWVKGYLNNVQKINLQWYETLFGISCKKVPNILMEGFEDNTWQGIEVHWDLKKAPMEANLLKYFQSF